MEGRTPRTSPLAKPVPDRRAGEKRDRLAAETIVQTYVDDRRTKAFLRDFVHACSPSLRDKSGQWYWLNEGCGSFSSAAVGP